MAKAASTKKVTPKYEARSSDVALEWICFGLWEWALVALSILLSATLSYYFVDSSADYVFIIYVLAAVICLLPMAMIVESMYRKKEPEQKHGFAGVVMVLNAVVVFLATIAAFITAVMSVLSVFVNAHSSSGTYITIISSIVVTALGMMLFVRIVNPPRLSKITRLFPIIVLLISLGAVAAAVSGPFKAQIENRDDRFIEDNLGTLNSAVVRHVYGARELPASLNDVSYDTGYEEGAKALAEQGLVNYRPDTKTAKTEGAYTTYYYRLCVTFKESKGEFGKQTRELYMISSSHGSGRQCYDQEAEYFDDKSGADVKR
jgi:hypothetical protein